MWKPDASPSEIHEFEVATDLQPDAAVQVWDGWMMRMYLELTLDEARRTYH